MEYRKLGSSGLKVSAIGLGTNQFGLTADEATTAAIVDRAIEAGVNFIDTADWYNRGRSEEFIGKAIRGKRSQVIIATKFGREMGAGPNERGGSRHHIVAALDASLKRLQTDCIDLYQLHVPDLTTPIGETLSALDDLVRSGKVHYVGCCNLPAWQLCEAEWTSRLNRLHSFVTAQVRYNILERDIEKELVPCCQAYGVGVIPWGPLAGGFLTGKYRRGQKAPEDARLSRPNTLYGGMLNEANWGKLEKLEAFAARQAHTMGDLAIAWLLSKPWVSTVIAGARQAEQVTANVASGEWKLTAEEIAQVEAILGAA